MIATIPTTPHPEIDLHRLADDGGPACPESTDTPLRDRGCICAEPRLNEYDGVCEVCDGGPLPCTHPALDVDGTCAVCGAEGDDYERPFDSPMMGRM